MERNTCCKGYPKEYCANAVESVDGYPKYRRRDNGDVGNWWVVPHNPWLLLKYGAHINLETCMYIYKGHDCIQLEFSEKLNHD